MDQRLAEATNFTNIKKLAVQNSSALMIDLCAPTFAMKEALFAPIFGDVCIVPLR